MRFPALGAFLRFTDNHVIAVRTGDGAFDQKHVLVFTHLNDLKVLRCATNLAHVTGHFHSAHDRAWEQTLANCTRAAMPALRAVSRVAAAERVTPDDAFET